MLVTCSECKKVVRQQQAAEQRDPSTNRRTGFTCRECAERLAVIAVPTEGQ